MALRLLKRLFRRPGRVWPMLRACDRQPYQPREMARLLERERDRTNRTGLPFAMVVFHADPHMRREVRDALTRVLASRLRVSDEFGYLDRHRLAAVLPATPAGGAWTVADDICFKLPLDLPLPRCEVYAYPGEPVAPFDAGSDSGSDDMNADGHGAGNGDRRRLPRVNRHKEGEPALAVAAMPARSLTPWFVQPLPWWKRCIDIVTAAAALLVLSPVLLLAAAAVRWTSPGPVLFRQMRSGLGGRPFVFYKFRSMVADAETRKAALMAMNEQDGPAFKIRRDPRITAVGGFLRKTSVDELPQLWNVLRGDMSLVGPRPLPCNESEACVGWHRRRLDVTPGLTCIWQVEGRSRVSFDEWVRMDIRYMRMRSLLKDAVLMMRTLPAMLLRRGV